MIALAFVLQCAALAALVGVALSLLAWPVAAALGSGRWVRSAALRAELALVAGALPAVGVAAALLGAVLPSAQAFLLGAADHCHEHLHHFHLCFLHLSGLEPPLALAGAAALAAFLFRLGGLLRSAWRERAGLEALRRLGRRRDGGEAPVYLVPGGPLLCHAAGVLRPLVVVSESLAERLDGAELEAALAHERAHLARRDPLALALLGASRLFSLPWASAAASSAYRSASEATCDEAARRAVGDGAVVASALLKVASLRRRGLASAPAFGEHALERRVRALLAPSTAGRIRSAAPWTLAAVALVAASAAVLCSAELHHALETALFHLV